MFLGIVTGLVSALFMSLSYIFSRIYFRQYPDPVQLAVHSLIIMGIWGAILLGICSLFLKIPWGGRFLLLTLGETVFFLISQTGFFLLLKEVEASRAASFLGLKLIAIALLSACFGQFPNFYQALAIVLCTIAAVGMNFSGGKLTFASILYLLSAAFFYSACDICITEMMKMMPAENSMLTNALGVMGVCYTAMGSVTLPFLWKYPFRKELVSATLKYSFFYFSSILFLMACFGAVGVVFGSILQAGRGILSVLLGVILLKLGWEKNEPDVSRKVWIRRLTMAVLMVCAMTLYTVSSIQ